MTAKLVANLHGYDEDFALWSEEQAELIRNRQWSKVDLQNVAEEIEGLGRSDKRSVRSHLRVAMLHLLKQAHQPRLATQSWQDSIDNARDEIEELLAESPSLRPQLPDLLEQAYSRARKDAARETSLSIETFPVRSPFSVGQVLDPNFILSKNGETP